MPQPTKPDMVNHPAYYAKLSPEPIDVIEGWGMCYHLGQVLKYISRAGRKDPSKHIEDLRKAAWYLNRHIENLVKAGRK